MVLPFKFPAPLKSFRVFISELYKPFGVFQMTGVCVSISLACLGLSAHISVETYAGTRPPEQQPPSPPQHSQGPGPRILPCEGGTKSCKNPLDGVKCKDANWVERLQAQLGRQKQTDKQKTETQRRFASRWDLLTGRRWTPEPTEVTLGKSPCWGGNPECDFFFFVTHGRLVCLALLNTPFFILIFMDFSF